MRILAVKCALWSSACAAVVWVVAISPAVRAADSPWSLEHHRSSVVTSSDGVWEGPPGDIGLHTSVYDPVRHRMLVFGGSRVHGRSDDVWAMSLTGTPKWTLLHPEGTAPGARFGHSAIYDPVRDRMLVFGGVVSGDDQNDLWALSLSGTPTWTQLTPAGTPPPPQNGHNAVYDFQRDRMVVLGGFSYFQAHVWALTLSGTPTWTKLTPTGTIPPLRQHASAIYDTARERVILFGGDPGAPYLNDVWALTLTGTPAWMQLSPAGTKPAGRTYANVILDPDRDRMVVYGGMPTASTSVNDTWELSLTGQTTWIQLAPAGPLPEAREGHTAINDQASARMIVFGGAASPERASEVSALSLSGSPVWSDVTPGGIPPRPRGYHSAIRDPLRGRMLMYGGWDGSDGIDEVWEMSLDDSPTWTQLLPTGDHPAGRGGHSAVYDPLRDRMLVFGGFMHFGRLGDLWALSMAGPPAWTSLVPIGAGPEQRAGHAAVYDPLRDRMLVFGGFAGAVSFNDVWSLSLSGPLEWQLLAPTGTPPQPRAYASAEYDPLHDRVIVYGGRWFDDSDLWALSLGGTPAWAPLAPDGSPPVARSAQSVSYDARRGRAVIFGGSGPPSGYLNDAWGLSLRGTPTWSAFLPDGDLPPERSAHSAIYDPDGDRLVVFGGEVPFRFSNEAWFLKFTGTLAVGGWDEGPVPPAREPLQPPVPNPMSSSTSVQYSVARTGRVSLTVLDVNGRLVRRLLDGPRDAGSASVTWDGRGESGSRLGPGIYFIRFAAPGTLSTRRVVLLR